MSASTAVAIVLAGLSTTLTNVAYLREHDAAAALPVLSLRRPLHSARLLLADRSWLLGFGMETAGFLLYAGALALASLSLVQSINAGGIGVLAYVSARVSGRQLGSGAGGHGSTTAILLWLGVSGGVAAIVVLLGRPLLGTAVAAGAAGGIFFS